MTDHKRPVAVALGGNLAFQGLAGAELLRAALGDIIAAGYRLISASGAWESQAWPNADQPTFVNAVIVLDARAAAPQQLYADLLNVEQRYGRERRERWAPRTLDLDIIDFDGLVLDQSAAGGLVLPHPRAHERAFVLAPLAEAWPEWRHPVLGRSAAELLAALPGDRSARRLGALIAPAQD